jgi:hypothetical protein
MVNEISAPENWNVVNVPLGSFFENGKKAYDEDTKKGVKGWLNTSAYQMLGTYGTFEEGNRYGVDFGERMETGFEKKVERLKNELRELIGLSED